MISHVKRSIPFLLIFLIIICFSGCCSHTWDETDCTETRTCTSCGETAEPAGHNWLDADCFTPKTCDVCGLTEGNALGHSTKSGICSRCDNEIRDLEYNNGYAVVTYNDIKWMQIDDVFIDIYVVGKIKSIDKTNSILIEEAEGGQWTADVGTDRDFSAYIGTTCHVYGFSTGGISSVHNTPLINLTHDDNRIVFSDEKTLYPNNYESTQQFASKFATGQETVSGSDPWVWVPTEGGTKYHSKSNCSKMQNPIQLKKSEAINQGYGKCGKCW